MPNFKENKMALLFAHQQKLINNEEFLLLYDVNTFTSPTYPYWAYPNFELDALSDDECKSEFRFFCNDIYLLMDIMRIPQEIICYNGLHVDGSPEHTAEKVCLPLQIC